MIRRIALLNRTSDRFPAWLFFRCSPGPFPRSTGTPPWRLGAEDIQGSPICTALAFPRVIFPVVDGRAAAFAGRRAGRSRPRTPAMRWHLDEHLDNQAFRGLISTLGLIKVEKQSLRGSYVSST